MNHYPQEVQNCFGKEMLSAVQKEFPNGFHITGCSEKELVVGDKTQNCSFSRKTNKLKSRFVFKTSSKLKRK